MAHTTGWLSNVLARDHYEHAIRSHHEDVGNIAALEHVNVRVAEQTHAHLFYVTGMGFTRDPYIDFGIRNMWINLGRQQFHLPVGEPQVLRGRVGITTRQSMP